jgi:nucleoside-diphosphate-sugar epimerase
MPSRVALTGATGFVGRQSLSQLLDAGHSISALVRNAAAAKLDARVRVVEGDLQNIQALHALTQNADLVVHVAGVVSAATRAAFFEANANGTAVLAKIARENAVKRFVLVSSLAAREPALNAYAASKAAAETEAAAVYEADMLTILRPAAVYGPGDTATLPLLKALMSALAIIPGTARAQFSMIHVRDVARILVDVVAHPQAGIFELDDGSGGYDWAALLAICRKHFGRPGRAFFLPRAAALGLGFMGDGIARIRGKASLVHSGQMKQLYHADWRVREQTWVLPGRTALEQGLVDTITWYQNAGLLPRGAGPDRSAATANQKNES